MATTEEANLHPGLWVERLCDVMTARGETGGRLFRRRLVPSRLFEFEHDFYKLLREVQSTTPHIDKSIDVESSFGILRSARRGMTAHARNQGVSKDMLQTFNRWNSAMNSTTGAPRLDMAETYSDLAAIKPHLLNITRVF